MEMTETEIVKLLSKKMDERKYPFQLPNSFIYPWESDYWVMTASGETREFEIKISRSDFFCDAKKDKHTRNSEGANYFYYVCPRNMITKDEVDKKYGLIYIWDTGFVEIVKNPRKLNDNKFNKWRMLANKMYWKWRTLWREKYINKEITYEEWSMGLSETFN